MSGLLVLCGELAALPPKKRLPFQGSLWEQRRGASKALLDLGIALGQDLVGAGAEGAAEEGLLVQAALRVQDAVGPGVAAAGDPCPLRRGVADGSLLECQQRTQRRVREAAVADQIADGQTGFFFDDCGHCCDQFRQ